MQTVAAPLLFYCQLNRYVHYIERHSINGTLAE